MEIDQIMKNLAPQQKKDTAPAKVATPAPTKLWSQNDYDKKKGFEESRAVKNLDKHADAEKFQTEQDKKKEVYEQTHQFLHLMLEQMKSQNPTKPTDSAQITQVMGMMNLAERSIEQTERLDQMLEKHEQQIRFMANTCTGKDVAVDSSEFTVENYTDKVNLQYTVPHELSSCILHIYNSKGELVHKQLGACTEGMHTLEWNPKDMSSGKRFSEGKYHFSIEAKDMENNALHISPTTMGKISEVIMEKGQPPKFRVNGQVITLEQMRSLKDQSLVTEQLSSLKDISEALKTQNGMFYMDKYVSVDTSVKHVDAKALKDGKATFDFQIDQPTDRTYLRIFNVYDKEILNTRGPTQAGTHKFEWNLTDAEGKVVPEGIYRLQISTDIAGKSSYFNAAIKDSVKHVDTSGEEPTIQVGGAYYKPSQLKSLGDVNTAGLINSQISVIQAIGHQTKETQELKEAMLKYIAQNSQNAAPEVIKDVPDAQPQSISVSC